MKFLPSRAVAIDAHEQLLTFIRDLAPTKKPRRLRTDERLPDLLFEFGCGIEHFLLRLRCYSPSLDRLLAGGTRTVQRSRAAADRRQPNFDRGASLFLRSNRRKKTRKRPTESFFAPFVLPCGQPDSASFALGSPARWPPGLLRALCDSHRPDRSLFASIRAEKSRFGAK